MSRPGCSCKSANEPNPNCAYCGNKNKQATTTSYYNDPYQGGGGCKSCKSASEPNPNCAYCGNKNKQGGYYNDPYQGGYGYGYGAQPSQAQSYNKPGCCCKSANEPSPNCAYCGNKNKQAYYDDQYNDGSEYSYGTQYSAASNASPNTSSWALLRPVLVFGLGSFLTSKMVMVASELG